MWVCNFSDMCSRDHAFFMLDLGLIIICVLDSLMIQTRHALLQPSQCSNLAYGFNNGMVNESHCSLSSQMDLSAKPEYI